MQLQRQQLANGNISVWLDGNETVIHHANGLTIALTEQEAQELRAWLDEQDATWAERQEFLELQRMEQES